MLLESSALNSLAKARDAMIGPLDKLPDVKNAGGHSLEGDAKRIVSAMEHLNTAGKIMSVLCDLAQANQQAQLAAASELGVLPAAIADKLKQLQLANGSEDSDGDVVVGAVPSRGEKPFGFAGGVPSNN